MPQLNSFPRIERFESVLARSGWTVRLSLLSPGDIAVRSEADSTCGHLDVTNDGVLEVSGLIPKSSYGAFLIPENAYFHTDRASTVSCGQVTILPPETRYRIIFRGSRCETVLLRRELVEGSGNPSPIELSDWIAKSSRIETGLSDMGASHFHFSSGLFESGQSPQSLLLERTCQLLDKNHEIKSPSEMAKMLDVGIRTLERAFSRGIAIPPSRYLIARRLNAAFRALADKSRKESSVTEIALEHAFTHLGRFSVSYRDLFGESPKETLKRSHSR